MKKKKWFEKNFAAGTFRSKRRARTLDEAFEKSIEKWRIIEEEGLRPLRDITTCGLCELYNDSSIKDIWMTDKVCNRCPIHSVTKQSICIGTPIWKNSLAELWFLRGLARRMK